MFGGMYSGKRVLITGHTGFKGSWLALWLTEMGAKVTGMALEPEAVPSHWDAVTLPVASHILDIRDTGAVQNLFAQAQPEIVFHLAAQSLVRRSYRNPLDTWSSNVMGTASVLEACRQTPSVRAVVAITTDKVYDNQEWSWGYRENDRLGGHDPYSASKAACELVADSYRKSFFSTSDAPLLATARAGNVIGGGDWSEDRLIPDLVRAVSQSKMLEIRSPNATRPWQHVLDCLSGYLQLGQGLLEGRREWTTAWNFGPGVQDNRTVAELLNMLAQHWPEVRWAVAANADLHEASQLYLDSSKARQALRWRPVWSLESAVSATAEWYRAHTEGRVESGRQLASYFQSAEDAGVEWAKA